MLEITDLTLSYPCDGGDADPVPVLSSFCLQVPPGKVVGLVGESGSGKTSVALATLGLLDPNARIDHGEILWHGRDLCLLGERGLREIRGKQIALIIQQPQAALNPVLRVRRQLCDLLALHRGLAGRECENTALALLKRVGIADPLRVMDLYPRQLSGGMAQRVMIAMALACEPELLVADEPTASLDVTVQAQIMDLLLEIRDQSGMAILLISHDLGVVSELCDTVAVAFRGRIVEHGPVTEVCSAPAHPYTRALMEAIPGQGRHGRRKTSQPTEEASDGWHQGCAYAGRCRESMPRCLAEQPPAMMIAAGHAVSCWARQAQHSSVGVKRIACVAGERA